MTDFLIIVLLVLVNGVFAGAEIAVIAVRKTRLQQLAEGGNARARSVLALRNQPERFLATVQVGITVIGATAAAFGGANAAKDVAPWIMRIPALVPYASELAIGVMVVLVSYLSLILGELVPKSLALHAGERYALLISKPLLALAWLARPVVWFLTTSSNLVLRPFGDRTTFTETRLSREELTQLVEEAAKAGAIDQRSAEIAVRAIDFADLIVEEVMVPRSQIKAIPLNAAPDELRSLLTQCRHQRWPVFEESVDDIKGYVNANDIWTRLDRDETPKLADLVRPVYFAPESMRASDVMRHMQGSRVPVAIVVDEHGGVSGLLTLEDLLEELVGEIVSEYETPIELIRKEPDGGAIVHGHVPVRDLNRALDLKLAEDQAWSTVGGLCTALAGRIPERGARLTASEGVVLEVLEASPRLVRLVRVIPSEQP